MGNCCFRNKDSKRVKKLKQRSIVLSLYVVSAIVISIVSFATFTYPSLVGLIPVSICIGDESVRIHNLTLNNEIDNYNTL